MKYAIWVTPIQEKDDCFGVEVQPPLNELTAQGLCRVLTYLPEEQRGFSSNYHAEQAVVTRSDELGTAFTVYSRDDDRNFTAEYLAGLFEHYMNPSQAPGLEIELHYT